MVSLDLSDDTWVWQILGRDQDGLFRSIDLEHSIATQAEASEGLRSALSSYKDIPDAVFPQENALPPGNTCDLLTPKVPDEKLFAHFKTLIGSREYSAAAQLLKEFCPVFTDVDGNFVEQFQTTGFNARLWELYLDRMLKEQDFHRITDYDRPDYCVMKDGFPLAIEAVTVNPSPVHPLPVATTPEESQKLLSDFMPLRFSGPLMKKLRKRYWELPHMAGIPIIIAIHDYFTDDSMTWSLSSLTQYLYGLRGEGYINEDGNADAKFNPIESHEWEGKNLPSGFFNQPGAENISAVLANNAASLNKFNRMGKEARFGDPEVRLHRIGTRYDPDPKAAVPIFFDYEVSPLHPRERWSDEVVLFLNPNAKNRFPVGLFEASAVHTVEGGRVVSYLQDHHIMFSRTVIAIPPKEAAASGGNDQPDVDLADGSQ
jgi:hypothetical protein